MIKSKELKESHSKEKLLNTKKLLEPKESQSKELSPTIMPLKLKSNTFLNKSNKPSLNMNQLKESGKEFNIFQLKLKLFTIQKEITTSRVQVNTSKPDTLNQQEDILLINKVPPTFHLKVESELKPFTKLGMYQFLDQLLDKEDLLVEVKLNMLLEVKHNMLLDQLILLELPTLPPVKPTLLEEVELEEKMFTELPKPEVMLLEEVELDNDLFINFIISILMISDINI